MQAENNDPFGLALWDYYRGKKEAEIIVHCSDTDEDIIPVSYLFRTFQEMPELEKLALKECRGRILDVGAGGGCHALELQKQGKPVTAIDISGGAVKLMQERGVKDARQVNVYKFLGEKFDTILMLMNGIGIVGTLEGLELFLLHLKSLLKPGGQVLLESSDIIYLFTEEDGSVLIDLNDDYYGQLTYHMEYEGVKGLEFDWLFIDALLLQDYADAAGFQCEVLYEDGEDRYLAKLTLKA
jgi:SAM-dependent methyltransferase